jgi:VWFA-related protein
MRIRSFAAVAFLATLAEGQESRQIPTFTSKIDLVTVDVVVIDAKGRLAHGLVADDFSISEDGKPQTIASFEAVELSGATGINSTRSAPGAVATNMRHGSTAASSFVLLVDDMSLAPARQGVVRTAIARFLADGARDGDEVILATTSGDVWWSARMPEGREDLLALTSRVRGRYIGDVSTDSVSEWEAYRIIHSEGVGNGSPSSGGTAGGATVGAATSLSSAIPGASATDRVVTRFCERRLWCNCDFREGLELCYATARAKAREVDTVRRSRTVAVSAAVDRAVFALSGVRGRKSLLLLTEGFLDDADQRVVRTAAGRCGEANIAVYSLDVRGLVTGHAAADGRGTPNPAELAVMQLEQTNLQAAGSVGLAEETGGVAIHNTNDLAAGAARIAAESRAYYLLGYSAPEGKSPRDWRSLEVKVKRSGFTARARKGYTLRTTAEIAAADEARLGDSNGEQGKRAAGTAGTRELNRVPAAVARALASARDVGDIPIRAMAYALEGRPGGTVRTLLAIEADTQRLANLGGDERSRSVLALSILVSHRDSGKTQRLDQRIEVNAGATTAWEGWLTVGRDFDLPPGIAQARVVVRDEFLGRLGALTVRFVVPEVAGLRISTPLVTDRLSPPGAGTPARPVLVAHRDFAQAGHLYCQFQIFGGGGASGGSIEASYELRHREGRVIREGGPSTVSPGPDGRLVRLLAMPLDDMRPGAYELVLRVVDRATGETQERIESFDIAARQG